MALIVNARVYTGGDSPEFLDNGAVYYENGIIEDYGRSDEMKSKHPNAEIKIDANGKLLLPGFVCAHAHYYGMYARGMPLKDDAPVNFKQILERLWWRLDRALELEDCYLSAMVFLIQAIKSGTTTVIDHHASPNAILGSLDVVAKAVKEVGIRSCLCYEVTDRNGIEGATEGIEENMRFIKKCFVDEPDPKLSATFGLHAAFTVSDETLDRCAEALRTVPEAQGKTGFHIHVAEGPTDAEHSLAKYGKRTLVRLRDKGILMPTTIAAHCVDIDEEELKILAETGTKVVHNPESNMNNAVGVSDVLNMMDKGVCVGLGTDGMTLDMFQESKVNYLVHKLSKGDPRVMGGETLQMLHANNARIASQYFPRRVGAIEKDSFADFALVNYDPPTPLHAGNMPWHLQFGMSADMVDTVLVGGDVLMQDRQLVFLKEADIMRRARERCPGVWDRF